MMRDNVAMRTPPPGSENRDPINLNWMKLEQSERKRILLVDDEEEFREILREILSDSYEVLEAEDGEQALDCIQRQKPDLVVLDIRLPGRLDGLEVCRLVKSDPQLTHIPILLLTALDIEPKKYKRVRPDAFFVKPFSPLDLLDKISEILG